MKKSFTLEYETCAVFRDLSDEEAGKLIKMVVNYSNPETQNNPTEPIGFTGMMGAVFHTFKLQLDKDLEKWERRRSANIINGNKGGRPKKKTKKNPKKPIGLSKKKEPSKKTQVMLTIENWFRRKLSTQWTEKELKALKNIGDIPDDDLDLMEKYYLSGWKFLRKDIITLLNNWTSELDRARGHCSKNESAFEKAKQQNLSQEDLFQ